MKPADIARLFDLYTGTDDPWDFRGSPYESERLDAVAEALPRRHYVAALELGCGNGELARRIAPRCESYTGLDAVPAALEASRVAVPAGRFVEAFLPCTLPNPPEGRAYDLVLLSEVLYFLDRAAVAGIAAQIDRDYPAADVVTVTWRGATGHVLSGDDAVSVFATASRRSRRTARLTAGYRIVTFFPLRVPYP